MKEHPDYKYRPRRKPKSLIKKEPKFGFSISPLLSPSMDSMSNIQRTLMPPIPPSAGLPPLISHDSELKIPRTLFPPFPYPLYPTLRQEESKIAADFALLYGSSLYSQGLNWPLSSCNIPCGCPPNTFPTTPRRTPSPDGIKRPVYVLMKPDECNRSESASSHVI